MTKTQWRQTWHEYREYYYEIPRHFCPGDDDIPRLKLSPEAWRIVQVARAPERTVRAMLQELVYRKRPDLDYPF